MLRLRPPWVDERRPDAEGLRDLRHFLGELPRLVAIGGATGVRMRGGAHVTVACAVGAAIPTTLVGRVEVIDTSDDVWELVGQAPDPKDPPLLGPVTAPVYNSDSGPVLVYVDLLPQRSDAAFDKFVADETGNFAGVLHLRPIADVLLPPQSAAELIGELTSAIRGIANTCKTTAVHLLLRCPFPAAVLLGRSLNTLTVSLYEWEDGPGPDGDAGTPRYLPSVVLRSGAGGSPIHQVTAVPTTGATE